MENNFTYYKAIDPFSSVGHITNIVVPELISPISTKKTKLDKIEKVIHDKWFKNNLSVKDDKTPVTTKDNSISNKAYTYLMNKGLPDYKAAAIVGNMMQESGGNVGIVGKDKHDPMGSFGLFQWAGNRRAKLHLKYGENPTMEQLLDFLLDEMNTSEKANLTKHGWDNAQDIDSATEAFTWGFERPSKQYANLDKRKLYAKSLLS